MGKLFVFSIEDPQNPEMVFYLTSKTHEFEENDNAIDLDDPNNKFFSDLIFFSIAYVFR